MNPARAVAVRNSKTATANNKSNKNIMPLIQKMKGIYFTHKNIPIEMAWKISIITNTIRMRPNPT